MRDRREQIDLIWFNKEVMKRRVIFFFILAIAVMSVGCSTKVVTIKEPLYIPTRCEVSMPQKPEFNALNLNSAKEIVEYHKEIEALLEICIYKEVRDDE